MASTFPNAIDSFTDPLSGSALNSPSHSAQHADLNDAAEKIETYMGLVKVIPTSATNGTVGATGTVTVGNAVGSVTVSGAFSSLYNNYKILYTGGVANTSLYLSMTLGSASTAYYGSLYGAAYATGTPIGIGINNGASWAYAGLATTSYTMFDCDIFMPNMVRNTNISSKWSFNLTSTGYSTFNGEHAATTQHTAFTITATGGNMTGGSLTVYGYRI